MAIPAAAKRIVRVLRLRLSHVSALMKGLLSAFLFLFFQDVLDLLGVEDLAHRFHLAVHDKGRRGEDAELHDLLHIGDLADLELQPQLPGCLFRFLGQFLALRATRSQDLDLKTKQYQSFKDSTE